MNLAGYQSNRPVYRYEPVVLRNLSSNLNSTGTDRFPAKPDRYTGTGPHLFGRPNHTSIPVPNRTCLAGPVSKTLPVTRMGQASSVVGRSSHCTPPTDSCRVLSFRVIHRQSISFIKMDSFRLNKGN